MFTLKSLPYAYNALAPHISEQTMRLHHDKHHQSYVDGLNKAEQKLSEARASGDFSLVKHWERELAFHGSGHLLHSIFWPNMSPQGGGHQARLRKLRRFQQPFSGRCGGRGGKRLGNSGLSDADREAGGAGSRKTPGSHSVWEHSAARSRRLGARLLSQVSEPSSRLHQGVLQRHQLG